MCCPTAIGSDSPAQYHSCSQYLVHLFGAFSRWPEVTCACVLQPIRQKRAQVPIPQARVLVTLIRAQWKGAHKHHHRLQRYEYYRVLSAQTLILRG